MTNADKNMIKPNELRLGNYVNYDGIYKRKKNYMPLEYGYFIMKGNGKEFDISPIPLTPEILDKCGFCNDGLMWNLEYSINGQVLYISLGIFKNGFFLLPNGKIRIKGVEIKYVHQLQNLYFALTGEELEIPILFSD